MRALESKISEIGQRKIVLHSQVHAIPFYQSSVFLLRDCVSVLSVHFPKTRVPHDRSRVSGRWTTACDNDKDVGVIMRTYIAFSRPSHAMPL